MSKASSEQVVPPKLWLTLDKLMNPSPSSNKFLLSALMPPKEPTFPGDDSDVECYPLDLQNLIMWACAYEKYIMRPRWCRLYQSERIPNVTVVICDNIAAGDIHRFNLAFDKNKASVKDISFIKELSNQSFDFISAYSYGQDLLEELLCVPVKALELTTRQNQVSSWTSPQSKAGCHADGWLIKKGKRVREVHPRESFPRTLLLLTVVEMSKNNFPLLLPGMDMETLPYVNSKTQYLAPTDSSPLFGLDCEMVNTDGRLQLARVTLVNERHQVVYDELVKPQEPVTDYLTRYSGVTKEILDPVTKRLSDAQRELGDLLPGDAILVGHSLNCDLHCLQMFHPYVIDTSVVFNMSGNRSQKASLKSLVARFLNRAIQGNKKGHSSQEDAIAALELVQLKLSKSLEFGDYSVSQPCPRKVLHKSLPSSPPRSSPVKRVKLDDTCHPQPDGVLLSQGGDESERMDASGCTEEEVKATDVINRLCLRPDEAFFSNSSLPWRKNALDLMHEWNLRTAVIDRPQYLETLVSKAVRTQSCVNLMECSEDETATRLACKMAQVARLSIVTLRRFTNITPETDWKTRMVYLQSCNENMRTIYDSLPRQSLLIVIFSGSATSVTERGRCFVKLKEN